MANVLEQDGIRTYLEGANSGDVLSGYELATGGVKILVDEVNAERAHELLAEYQEESEQTAITEDWTCRVVNRNRSGFLKSVGRVDFLPWKMILFRFLKLRVKLPTKVQI